MPSHKLNTDPKWFKRCAHSSNTHRPGLYPMSILLFFLRYRFVVVLGQFNRERISTSPVVDTFESTTCNPSTVTWDPCRPMTRIIRTCETYYINRIIWLYEWWKCYHIHSHARVFDTKQTIRSFRPFNGHIHYYISVVFHSFVVYLFYSFFFFFLVRRSLLTPIAITENKRT